MKPLRLSSAVRRDIEEVKAWYGDQGPDLDLRFGRDLDALLSRLIRFPTAYPRIFRQVRRANLTGFPYGVFYVERRKDLLVIAVMHHARHPRRWQRRL